MTRRKDIRQELGEEPPSSGTGGAGASRRNRVWFAGETVGRPCGCRRLSRREDGRRGQIIQDPVSQGKEVGFYLDEFQCLKRVCATI